METPSSQPEPPGAPETNLISFVLRFVCDGPVAESARPTAQWYGVIRHVQSNTERHFTHWTEAVAFIARYVDVDKA